MKVVPEKSWFLRVEVDIGLLVAITLAALLPTALIWLVSAIFVGFTAKVFLVAFFIIICLELLIVCWPSRNDGARQ